MKEKIFAVVTIVLVISAVTLNTLKMHQDIDEIYSAVNIITNEDSEKAKKHAEEAYEVFRKKEPFIGLTVNHDDLSNIEEAFAEMIGFLSVGDVDGATVTKNRLLDALGHLRRLSGFNIDAII